MRVTLFDYGAGNLHSLLKALAGADRALVVETDPRKALRTGVLVLPGVGAFGAAAARLGRARDSMRDALRDGLPCLGICLGMQLLCERSEEAPGAGIGLVAGEATRLLATRVPHIGWNEVTGPAEPLLRRSALALAYYANGYACRPADSARVTAWTTHETDRFPAVLRIARTIGVQFHPEKSSQAGLRFVRVALEELAEAAA